MAQARRHDRECHICVCVTAGTAAAMWDLLPLGGPTRHLVLMMFKYRREFR
jgi:hypothetical protein